MNWFEEKKIVVPIDFGEQSQAAVDESLNMAFRPSDIHVIHVLPDLGTMAPEVIWQEVSDASRRSSIESNFRKQFSGDKYRNLSFHVAFGDPGHRIAEYA